MTSPLTREEDSPEEAARIDRVRNAGRRRTIFYSVICAGIVSWFFGYMNDRDQISRSRTNCELIQEDRRALAEKLEAESDNILGDSTENPPIPGADFSEPPYDSLGEFEDLIVAQAHENRRRAKEYRSRIEHCKEVHPFPDLIPF